MKWVVSVWMSGYMLRKCQPFIFSFLFDSFLFDSFIIYKFQGIR